MSDVTSGEEEECNYAAIEKSKFGTLAIQDLLSAKNNSDWTCYFTGVLIGSTLVPLYLMGPLSCYLYGMYNAICLSTSTLCNFSGLSIFACCAANRTFRRTAKKEQKKYDNQIDRAELIEAAYLFLKEVSESRARLKKYCCLGGGIEFSDRKLKVLCLKIVYAHEAGYFIDRSFFDIHQEYQDVKTQLKEFHFIGQLANCKKNIKKTVERLFDIEMTTLEKNQKEFHKIIASHEENKDNCIIDISKDEEPTDELDVLVRK